LAKSQWGFKTAIEFSAALDALHDGLLRFARNDGEAWEEGQ